MADTLYNLETRLHQLATTLPLLSGYYQEYVGYSDVPFSISYKVEREIAHKYLELAGSAYFSGALDSTGTSTFRLLAENGNFLTTENGIYLTL